MEKMQGNKSRKLPKTLGNIFQIQRDHQLLNSTEISLKGIAL